jgi:hypothetical protein
VGGQRVGLHLNFMRLNGKIGSNIGAHVPIAISEFHGETLSDQKSNLCQQQLIP